MWKTKKISTHPCKNRDMDEKTQEILEQITETKFVNDGFFMEEKKVISPEKLAAFLSSHYK